MRAVIIALGYNANIGILNERYPSPLLPLIDRPFLQHVVESLVENGVTKFDFVLNHLPERIESFLGDGTRWGSKFQFHLVRDLSCPYDILKTIIDKTEKKPIMVAWGDRLPYININHNAHIFKNKTPLLTYCFIAPQDVLTLQWTGWALMTPEFIEALPLHLDENGMSEYLLSTAQKEHLWETVPEPLSIRSYNDLHHSTRRVLNGEFPNLKWTGREIEKGVWMSRNVSLHPTARLIPPVYIGENCSIGMGVSAGPYVNIGKNCIIEAGNCLEETIVLPDSYVGEGLELKQLIIDKNCVVNLSSGGEVIVKDDFILGSMSDSLVKKWFSNFFSRVMASLLLLIVWPILLAIAVFLKLARSGPVWYKKKVVRLPASPCESEWRTFELWSFCDLNKENIASLSSSHHLFLHFLPALINVARGELHFVGVAPRTKEEIKNLPTDWQTLYINAKAGIVTEDYVARGAVATADELYATETFYSVMAGIKYDARLLFHYFMRVFI